LGLFSRKTLGRFELPDAARTTFIMSYALARGMLAAGLAVTAAMTMGMIATIGGIALAAAFARDRFMGLLDQSEAWRHRVGMMLK
jgi:nickel/cobalt transporter (NicO) family protein